MVPEINTEYLIIGQGLAGSILAFELHKREKDFFVVAEPSLSQSSVIAAGIWNPVVFKRMTSSWKATEVIPVMHNFFSSVEKFLGEKFISKKKILKYFTEEQEADLWKKKYFSELSPFIEERVFSPDELNTHGVAKPEFGFSFVKESGNIDTNIFLKAIRKFLVSQNKYAEEKFDHTLLEIKENGFHYKNIFAKKIVFCEGFLNSRNPFFNFIPFRPAKGEVLIFECENLRTEHILQKGVFILPLGNNSFKTGATYEWNDQTDSVTEKAQHELEQKLQCILNVPYKITERSAGVRPSVVDRRPVLGEHPLHKNLYIFNGFGTKAVMLAPYFGNEMVNFILRKSEPDAEVNVRRFHKLFKS